MSINKKLIQDLNCIYPQNLTIQWLDLKDIHILISDSQDYYRLLDTYDQYITLRDYLNPKRKRFQNWIKNIEYDIFFNIELMSLTELDILEHHMLKKNIEILEEESKKIPKGANNYAAAREILFKNDGI